MNEVREEGDYGFVIFKPGTSSGEKIRATIFFVLLSTIIMAQACYWLFANKVEPIIMGMPFGMFAVVLLIVIEFAVLAALYLTESKTDAGKGGAA